MKVTANIIEQAVQQQEATPAQILRNNLHDVPSSVMAELPGRINLRKKILRRRNKDLPRNPMSITELHEI